MDLNALYKSAFKFFKNVIFFKTPLFYMKNLINLKFPISTKIKECFTSKSFIYDNMAFSKSIKYSKEIKVRLTKERKGI